MKNKVALVTGANRGIGHEIVSQLAKAGLEVILTARAEERGRRAAEKLKEKGLDVVFHQMDVTMTADIQKVEQFVYSKFGRLDILINNAAVIGESTGICESGILETSPADGDQLFRSACDYSGYASAIEKERGPACIINITSGMGSWNDLNGDHAAYKLSKAGLNSLTVMFSNALRSSNVKVNSVCPGWVRTEMGGAGAPRSVGQGADTIVWLPLAPVIPEGKCLRNRKEINW